MGRKIGQILWVNFSLIMGTYLGLKSADFLFWNDDIKYRVWENSEQEFWKNNGLPKHLTPRIEFESVVNPGTIFKSYLQEIGPNDYDEVLKKYDI